MNLCGNIKTMAHQSELTLGNNLIKQLVDLGYASAKVLDGNAFVLNLKVQLESFNKTSYSDKEFDGILDHLAKGNVFEKAKTIRDRLSEKLRDKNAKYAFKKN